MQDSKISVSGLNLFYGENHALKDINIKIRENTVMALIGPSGCGKSTFLKCLNRMNDLVDGVKVDGKVLLDGEDIYDPRVDTTLLRKKVGMVFQQPNPFPMSIYDNIAYGPRIHGIKNKSRLDEIVENALKGAAIFDEVKDRLKTLALGLSGGQQQRLCIARALAVEPEVLLMDASRCKKILSKEYQRIHFDNYTEESGVLARENLWLKRKPKIERVNQKIDKALSKVQQVTPSFIDQLIGLYERKNTSQKDRRYILLELKKYYSDKIIQFFFKLNDTELNKQLRWEAFYHLQSFNYLPRARRQKYMQVHTKNKKRKEFLKEVYPFETYEIPQNPNELEYRIENSREQKIKEYDFFISHSSKDGTIVQKLIRAENQNGKNIFCDWINDVDYLKRHLLCEATLKVLEKRMEQSKAMISVVSENSRNSVWCKYELNYFTELGKPIYCISKEAIDEGNICLDKMSDPWFLDADYKAMALIEGKNIKA